MTKRIIIPFSSSSLFLFSPENKILNRLKPSRNIFHIKDKHIVIKNPEKIEARQVLLKPWGIHVARIESLLFRLLKAVLIPTTIKNRLFPCGCFFHISSDTGAPFCKDSCTDLAAANSISKLEMVLSNVLQKTQKVDKHQVVVFLKSHKHKIKTYCNALCVLATCPNKAWGSLFTSFW